MINVGDILVSTSKYTMTIDRHRIKYVVYINHERDYIQFITLSKEYDSFGKISSISYTRLLSKLSFNWIQII